MECRFEVDEVVKVNSWGCRFSSYVDWFEHNYNKGNLQSLDLKYVALFQVDGDVPRPEMNMDYRILAIGEHHNGLYEEGIALIQRADAKDHQNMPTYLVGIEGLRKLHIDVSIEEAKKIVADYYKAEVDEISFV